MSSGVQFVFYTVCYFRLQPVWKNKRIGMTLKVRLCEALMISTMLLLYSAELWLLGPISYSKGKKTTIRLYLLETLQGNFKFSSAYDIWGILVVLITMNYLSQMTFYSTIRELP